MNRHARRSTSALFTAITVLVGCSGGEDSAEATAGTTSAATVDTASAHEAFFTALQSLCGRAFAGEATLIASPGFEGEMIMHVRRCTEDEVQIPLHVGENRSRTWIVTRTADGLRLKHDHRHEDGSEDAVTQYGGDTRDGGSATVQSFPADAFTAELLPEAAGNVWWMTLEPGERFTYHLARDGAPRATFEFDLTREVEPPPAPWGYEGT